MGIHVQGAPQNGRSTTPTLCPLIDEMLTVDAMKQNLRASCLLRELSITAQYEKVNVFAGAVLD